MSTIGDVVPAFSMNFVAPEPVVFTSPTFPANAPLGSDPTKMVVDPSKDLALAWEPTGAQTVVAQIEWSDSEAKRSDTVRCELSGAAGQGGRSEASDPGGSMDDFVVRPDLVGPATEPGRGAHNTRG